MKKEPINTDLICPTCGTHIDVKHIKQAVKDRLAQEFDYILERIWKKDYLDIVNVATKDLFQMGSSKEYVKIADQSIGQKGK